MLPDQPLRLPGLNLIKGVQPAQHTPLRQHRQTVTVDQTAHQRDAFGRSPQNQVTFSVGLAHHANLPLPPSHDQALPLLQHTIRQHDVGALQGCRPQILGHRSQTIRATRLHGCCRAQRGPDRHTKSRVRQNLLRMRMRIDQPRHLGLQTATDALLQSLTGLSTGPRVHHRHLLVLHQNHGGDSMRRSAGARRSPQAMGHGDTWKHLLQSRLRAHTGMCRGHPRNQPQGPCAAPHAKQTRCHHTMPPCSNLEHPSTQPSQR